MEGPAFLDLEQGHIHEFVDFADDQFSFGATKEHRSQPFQRPDAVAKANWHSRIPTGVRARDHELHGVQSQSLCAIF